MTLNNHNPIPVDIHVQLNPKGRHTYSILPLTYACTHFVTNDHKLLHCRLLSFISVLQVFYLENLHFHLLLFHTGCNSHRLLNGRKHNSFTDIKNAQEKYLDLKVFLVVPDDLIKCSLNSKEFISIKPFSS